MGTTKPISTISYNTVEFIENKLQKMYDNHLIQCYQYILHKGEDGDKEHIHLRIEPNKRLDPMDITAFLTEYVPGEKKPRVVRPWRPSNEEDWILYAIHDEEYLRLHNADSKDGKIRYKLDDVKVSYGYDIDVMYIRAKQKQENTTANLVKQIRDGKKVVDLLYEGRDVFRTRAILETLKATEYEQLCESYSKLNRSYEQIIDAILKSGHDLEIKDGKLTLI